MKIRNGYVSNSSSSSFVVKAEDFDKITCKTCKKLLKTILRKNTADGFLSEYWGCIDWELYKQEYGLDKDDVVYAAQIKYQDDAHEVLQNVLNELGITYMMENE